ncbi:MAG: hypothetical protein ACRDG9_10065, partial [Actinomycetota bacterium]
MLAEAKVVFEEAVEEAAKLGDPGLLAEARLARTKVWMDEGRLNDTQAEAEGAIRLLEELGDDLRLSRAWGVMAGVHWSHSRYAKADEALEQAVAHARLAGGDLEAAQYLDWYASSAVWGPLPVEDGIRRCMELLQPATASRLVEGRALWALAGLLAMRGEFHQAREHLAGFRAIYEELGQTLSLAISMVEGIIELLADDPAAAEAQLRPGVNALLEMGEHGYLCTKAAWLAQALYEQGRHEQAEEFTRVSEDAAADDDYSAQVPLRSVRAKVLAHGGEMGLALRLADEAVALATSPMIRHFEVTHSWIRRRCSDWPGASGPHMRRSRRRSPTSRRRAIWCQLAEPRSDSRRHNWRINVSADFVPIRVESTIDPDGRQAA